MRIAYVECPEHRYWHVADVDGFFLKEQGDDIMFRETRVVRRESVPSGDPAMGFQSVMVDVNPPRTEIVSEHPVARWFRVPDDTVIGVHPPEAFSFS
jgi:hypothetical protein